ncbi:MAG: enoyl-CoA hydratase/isomerase family protein [Deltaproteobacteria bacterium]|nr:enoyl-CoA hydratase/isomerase family protein [Deltaproteobacteria bacterium]
MSLVLSETIDLGRKGGPTALKITLNDPDNLNAMGEEMAAEFSALVKAISASSKLPCCIILTGAGRAFSAGGNLKMLEAKSNITPEKNRLLMLDFYNSFLSILALNVPLVAAINGHAVGAGLCLASACDLRVCSSGAKLGFTFGKLGLHPGMGATFFLPRIVGPALAAELLISGRMIDAAQAHEIGLVSQVVSQDALIECALEVAREIAHCGPESVRMLVESLRKGAPTLDSALEREAQCQAISYASTEFLEGVRATMEKRAPAWSIKKS